MCLGNSVTLATLTHVRKDIRGDTNECEYLKKQIDLDMLECSCIKNIATFIPILEMFGIFLFHVYLT